MKKQKIVLLALTVAMVAILAVGGTLAYLTDYDHQTNVFTTGNVGIDLDEAIVEEDPETDNLVDSGERTTVPVEEEEDKITQEYKLHPNMTVWKDPTITVDAESERAYVGAIITVKGDIYELFGVPGYDNIDVHTDNFVSGGLMQYTTTQRTGYGLAGLTVYESANDIPTPYAIYQAADKANNTWKLYIFFEEPMAANEKVVLFDTLTIPSDYDNDKMAKLDDMSIDVQAFAVQADGFEVDGEDFGCYNAMTEAFAELWPFGNDVETVEEKAAE